MLLFETDSSICSLPGQRILWGSSRCRHTSGRSTLVPYGNKGYEFVEIGTTLACRCILLIAIASYRKIRWLLEQPCNSVLPVLPQWQWLLSVAEVWPILAYSKATYFEMFNAVFSEQS